MVRIRFASQRSALVHPALAAVALFATTSLAQNNNGGGGGNNNNNNNNNDDNDDNDSPPSVEDSGPSPAPENEDNEGDNEPSPPAPTPSQDEEEQNEEPPPTPTPSPEQEDEPTPTPTPDNPDDSSPAPTPTPAPTRTEANDEEFTSFASLTNAPLIVTYPPAAVPPTVNAPFTQRSSAPEGTVFIVVGAILGAFGLGILLWRGIVACLLHRSVRRAALAQHDSDSKSAFPAPPAPFYKYSDHNSTLSLSAAGNARGTRRTNRGPIPSATPSQSNLFFSPTAASGAAGSGGGRDSRFLPSGFYAAGNPSSPGHTHSISLTNLRPDSRGLSRNAMRDHTPPESPQFPPARRDMSTSSLNLSGPPTTGRAPSAYLEDLLDENPSAFPPSNMPPANPQRGSPGSRF
ncbi:hypothetical protein SODALDRAFT_30399 [Sodiomyces alkalinus F11]|uniref:Mid2 domain-containing protein n=1 Tax=Sodiomyces alkalinus (strain CBS 110278 / VKM F-3762 / F11) TaxID=1314773 RepID=A0A3N2Q8R7_SODAK|nr:hypothetical protein SODALDRAFT_30399 [Sodiomyces alkalinus F11]ROT43087.1 hypothetical protein SODALDRAFT_30399 [Sodiomyces alkalinus F11]